MAGYSGTPLATKLGIKPGSRVAVLSAPRDFSTLEPLAPDAALLRGARKPVDIVLFFTKRSLELTRRFDELAARIQPHGSLWIAWPKKASGVATDLSFDAVQHIGLEAGLVDNKICAIDDTWSGLRFVYRLRDRPAEK